MAKAEDSKKATRRTADERIAEIDAKIAAHKETIKKLEELYKNRRNLK